MQLISALDFGTMELYCEYSSTSRKEDYHVEHEKIV